MNYEYLWWSEITCDGMAAISFIHPLEKKRSKNGVCRGKVQLCLVDLHFSHMLTLVTLSLRLSFLLAQRHVPLFMHSHPPISSLILPGFAYSPSTCQPNIFLCICQNCLKTQFIYFFYCFSATGSLKGKCAGWNRFVILPEPQEFPLGHLTDTFIHNNLRLAGMKELTDFGTQISWKWIIGNCFSCTK